MIVAYLKVLLLSHHQSFYTNKGSHIIRIFPNIESYNDINIYILLLRRYLKIKILKFKTIVNINLREI